jgi:hypothetical protein
VSNLTDERFEMNSFRERSWISVKGTYSPAGRVMVAKCANNWCLTLQRQDQGKLFRLDIDLGDKSGATERKTEYLWLCGHCAQIMHPKVEVAGDTITLRLTKNASVSLVADSDVLLKRAN